MCARAEGNYLLLLFPHMLQSNSQKFRIVWLRQSVLEYVSIRFNVATNLDQDELLTELELQTLLGVSRTTIWRLRKEAGLPFGRVGRQYRYRKLEVLRWLQDARGDAQFRIKFPSGSIR